MSQVWVFTFTGSNKSKYANELLELTCNFEFEYSEELQLLIKNNWLCNLGGLSGCWFPQDLLQEKNIKQLKKMAQRRDAAFGGDFFQQIVSVNIRAFLQAGESMRSAVRLAEKGGTHRRKKMVDSLAQLDTNITDEQTHRFREGRTYSHEANVDFDSGFEELTRGGKIKQFITRTLKDAGAIHGDDVDEDEDDGPEEVPLPNMMVGGQLLAGDEIDLDEEEEEARLQRKESEVMGKDGENATDSDEDSNR